MRRTATRLLKTVSGKPHATKDDHESSDVATASPMPTPPDSSRPKRKVNVARQPAVSRTEGERPEDVKEKEVGEEDYNRDPVSSDEEDMAKEKQFETRKAQVSDPEPVSKGDVVFKHISRSSDLMAGISPIKEASFKVPLFTSASLIEPPRRVLSDAELDESEEEDFVGRSQRPKKRIRNIHVDTRSAKTVVYGKTQKERTEDRAKERKKKEEKQKKRAAKEASIKSNTDLPAPAFKRRHLPDFLSSGSIAGATKGEDGSSSPLSSLSASPEPDALSIVCDTCHERVNKLLKEEYDDDYVKGKSWNIQWQERFCEWHRAQTAKETWERRGFPNINWMGLEKRMRQHDAFLLSVLRDRTKSHYRDEYAAKVKAKSMSNGFKDSTLKPGATVGYYGPKGEKAMSEHILNGLSNEIRERAKTDRLVSPAGYQGGVSGFVQGVLVPHLAELLIKDDMWLKGEEWEARARELITDSADVGELLHPEVDDRRPVVEEEDD